jgi:SAM-dependent methyltransferase
MAQTTHGLRGLLSNRWAYSGFQSLVGASHYYEKLVSDYIRPFAGARILDIGCGPADVLPFLGSADYVGFDSEERYIASARARYPERAMHLHTGDVRDVLLDDSVGFDIVLAIGVLHHLDDERASRLFELAAECLRVGGRVVTVDPCFETQQNIVARTLIQNDRGQNVRTASQYRQLAEGYFASLNVHVRRDLLRLPYSHAIVTAQETLN